MLIRNKHRILSENSENPSEQRHFEQDLDINNGTNASSFTTTYDTFYWFLCYIKMFLFRLIRDLMQSFLSYFNLHKEIPLYIRDLMNAQTDYRK